LNVVGRGTKTKTRTKEQKKPRKKVTFILLWSSADQYSFLKFEVLTRKWQQVSFNFLLVEWALLSVEGRDQI